MDQGNSLVDRFILEQIDTIPHLEGLLLVWGKRPQAWSVDEMAAALYVPRELALQVLTDLVQRGLLEETPPPPTRYRYKSDSAERDSLIALVSETYRRELIRVSRMVHSKAPSAVRDFARAFRFTKEKE